MTPATCSRCPKGPLWVKRLAQECLVGQTVTIALRPESGCPPDAAGPALDYAPGSGLAVTEGWKGLTWQIVSSNAAAGGVNE